MKLNIIPTLIAFIAAALSAYVFYMLSEANEEMIKTLIISGFASIFICLECSIGISYKDSQHTINSFIASMFFLIIFIIEHSCFAIWGTSQEWLIITTGLLLILYLLIYYSISKIKM